MTKPKRQYRSTSAAMEAELRKLRHQVERLTEQVQAERRRADKHADEVAVLHEIEDARARRRLNGVHP